MDLVGRSRAGGWHPTGPFDSPRTVTTRHEDDDEARRCGTKSAAAGRDADRRTAGALIRGHPRLVEMAGLAPRIVARRLDQNWKEGVEIQIGHLRRCARGGARVGMDRRAEGQARRRMVAPKVYASRAEKHLVEGQPR